MENVKQAKKPSVITVLKQTYFQFNADSGSLLAAAVSYNLLFSLFPFALAIISIAGFVMESPKFEDAVIAALGTLLPVARNMIANTLHGVVEARAATGIIALVGLVWSASAFFSALRESLNKAWSVKAVSYIKGKAIDMAMMVSAFVLLIVYVWLTTGVRILHTHNFHSDTFQVLNSTVTSATVFTILSSILAFLIILLLYKAIPSRRPRWKDIWLGALLAAIGFEIVRFVFIWYIKNFSHYNLVYGPIGAVIALLMFIYLAGWVLLFCAKLSAVNAALKSEAG